MKGQPANAHAAPRLRDPIPDRADRGLHAVERGWRPGSPGPDAVVRQGRAGRRRGVRHGESHGRGRFGQAGVEPPHAVLVACGLATYYCHVYLETDEDGQDGGDNSALLRSLYQDRAISSPALGSVWREGEACLAPTRRVVGAGYIRPEASRNNRTVPRLVGAADPAGNQGGRGDRLQGGEVVLLA